ncbi:MAG: 2,3-bisphosphoglycerate-independent phosphoglycerate mutase [Deltaproteobacteria bacterium]|nr:2,3-bisphosphoglycerate-independent phosphoglycerate mutase [Deltaproteobacteria bacterium]
MANHKPCMLMILDGWGIREAHEGNAVFKADTPYLDMIAATYPSTRLNCMGKNVGLPDGIMGNSEVGHLNIGAGRIVYQDLLRIDRAIENRTFMENEAFKAVMSAVKLKKSALHLMGLVSDGGVHSQLTHLLTLIDMAKAEGVERVYIHAILDGRDTPPQSGVHYLDTLQRHLLQNHYGRIASICGRYYAMDRDKRWERTQKAYRLYTRGEGEPATEAVTAVKEAYAKGETDEFVSPIVLTDPQGDPAGMVRDGDGIIFFNFRADRARQITRAFTDGSFDGFDRTPVVALSRYVCMTLYDETFDLPVAFEPIHLNNILGEIVSKNGLKQLRIAETEKYAHVTYFFNGGEESPFAGEDRCLIPSPREVATYDLKPEMSALEVTREVLERIASNRYQFIVLNFANMDMVGHTGILEAAVKACTVVDGCVEKIVTELQARGWAAMVTADHGNAEKMIAEDGSPHTAHTLGQVRFILVNDDHRRATLQEGSLCDIAPTVLDVMGIAQPEEMTGRSLIKSRAGEL